MKVKLATWWESLRSSYWFVPTLLALLAAGLALVTLTLDEAVQARALRGLGWIYTGGAEGARGLLSMVAGSMITVAGVTFSIAIAALTLASSQFGPRLLRNFMRDTGNQVVLGTFLATFLYCLLVLRTVRSGEEGAFVPHISVTVATGLAMASLGVLIYFIHHIAVAMQAATIIAEVGHDLDRAIERLFPHRLGQAPPEGLDGIGTAELPPHVADGAVPVPTADSGYLQAIDADAVLALATEYDMLIQFASRPGDFVLPGSPLALVWPGEHLDKRLVERLNAAVVLGHQRTLTQDVLFAVHQLVEIAVRALSPGINDPFTAMMCVDRLGAALLHRAGRATPSAYRYDDHGRLRIIAQPVTLVQMVEAAFTPIRQYGQASLVVSLQLLETIAAVGAQIDDAAARSALRDQAILVERGSQAVVVDERERQAVRDRYAAALRALARP